jgi:hypothetical protein
MPMLPAAPLEWAGAQVTDFGEGLKTETRCFKVGLHRNCCLHR